MRRRTVLVNDRMQRGYRYALSAAAGRGFDPEFRPQLTPAQMLRLGVFCGKYMTDCRKEFPESWFVRAKLAAGPRDCRLNWWRFPTIRGRWRPCTRRSIAWFQAVRDSGSTRSSSQSASGLPPRWSAISRRAAIGLSWKS